jgi:hypothetical protein
VTAAGEDQQALGLGVPEAGEVEDQYPIATPGERPRLGEPLAQVAAELVAEHQPGAAGAQHHPDQGRAVAGLEPEHAGRLGGP